MASGSLGSAVLLAGLAGAPLDPLMACQMEFRLAETSRDFPAARMGVCFGAVKILRNSDAVTLAAFVSKTHGILSRFGSEQAASKFGWLRNEIDFSPFVCLKPL